MTKKAKILVVEHDSVELASTARVLRSARFDVLEASSGAECLRTAKEHRPDLLLLSMELPDLHADQVCRDLKAEPTLKATVVLLVSAQGQSSEDRADALEMGADGCIVRPLGERELVAWVRSLVRTDQANTSALAQYKVVQDLRRSEDNLRREQQMLSEAQRIAHLGSWGWNILTNELSWSDEVYRIFGLKPQECGATYDTFLASVHADDRESVEEAVNRALTDSGAGYSMEHRVVHPDGSHRIVHGRGDVTFDSTGRPVRMIGTLHDITEQKVAELGLRDALAEVERLRDQLLAENVYLKEEIRLAHGFDEIVGRSEPLRGTLTRIEHVAHTDASVLLLGETGTGKELFARAIHNRSPRKDHPLVKVSCAALPSSLIESELFGHVKGAFTGALSEKMGRFELADGGTLFLDEIGELDPELQTKLLRVLQEGEFEKIGSTETRRVDIRVIAATNRDLQLSMEAGAFRQDLYYRLAVFPIKIPPLRQRREDIPLLVWHFITKKRARLGKTIDTVPKNVLDTLVQYEWPGNVRELENVIERSMILSSGPTLLLSESFAKPSESRRGGVPSSSLDEMDRTHIVGVLEDCGWRVKGANNAADRLGLKPSTLRYRMSKLGIERPPRRPR